MTKTKYLVLIILALFILPNISFAKTKYHTFTRKQIKIKYDAKLWAKKNHKVYLNLKLKSKPNTVKIKIKKTSLSQKGRKNLKGLKVNKFAKQYKNKVAKQFSTLNPLFQSAQTYKIKHKNYKIIKLNFNLKTGGLFAYYITNKKVYLQYIIICRQPDITIYNQDLRKITQSLRILPDNTAPTFAGTMNAVSTSTSSITLSWDEATDTVSYPENIKYLIYQANQLEEQDYATPNYTTEKGATSYQINNLQESTSYYFVVRAEDEAGNLESNQTQAIATTKATSNDNPTAGSLQNVTYQSNGSTVVGRMYRPNGAGPFPAIVFNHGGITPVDPSVNDARINALRQGDTYAVLATAYRGDTLSGGNLSLSLGDVNDTLAAIEYLKSKSYIDSNRIAMYGESRGGNVTLSAAERTTEMKAVVTWYPYTNITTFCDYLNENVYPGACLLYADFYGLADSDHNVRIASPINFVSRLTSPLQNSHGTADTTVPYSQSVELNTAMTGKSNYTFYEYVGADHGGSAVWATDGTAMQRLHEFIASYL
ncbi:MAG: prolyl oligopeptidase family serine peptidase [Patescibacteria group bacterium]|jgi:dienelactone hydrolase